MLIVYDCDGEALYGRGSEDRDQDGDDNLGNLTAKAWGRTRGRRMSRTILGANLAYTIPCNNKRWSFNCSNSMYLT